MTAAVLPAAVQYNQGETTIVQARFPEDSRFRDMPVHLNGIIAAPSGGDGPYPVVLTIHGSHHGCPEHEGGVDRWPCDPEVEQPNYQGFAYLVEALAAEGYVAIAPNFNAENTFGFGEGTPGERLSQLVELHLGALAEAANRQRLLVPTSADEMTTNLVGGAIKADGLTTFFCEEGYFTPTMKPGSEPCKRVNLTIPGNPAMVVFSWDEPGATLRLALPAEARDLSPYTTISMRAAVDPMSPFNHDGNFQRFSVQLTDMSGAKAAVQTLPEEPGLVFPPGIVEVDVSFEDGLFTGRVPMTTIRLLLSDFSGIDLSLVQEIALLFDQTPSGSLFLGDIELIKP